MLTSLSFGNCLGPLPRVEESESKRITPSVPLTPPNDPRLVDPRLVVERQITTDRTALFASLSESQPKTQPSSRSRSRTSTSALGSPRRDLSCLPTVVLAQAFSFLSIRENFSILPRISSFYGRFLHRRSAWPPQPLRVWENRTRADRLKDTDKNQAVFWGTASCDDEYKQQGTRSQIHCETAIPSHVLKRLGRLGFSTIHGVGPRSLPLLANPATRILECRSMRLSRSALAPLARMTSLEELKISIWGETDEGLCQLRGLPLTSLRITDSYAEIEMTGATRSALTGMPLKKLHVVGFMVPDLTEFLPRGLPLEELQIWACGGVSWNATVDAAYFPFLKKISVLKFPSDNVAALAKFPLLEDLEFVESTLFDEDLSKLSPLPIKKLSLAGCHEFTGKGLVALAGAPLKELDLSFTDVTDEGLLSLVGLPIEKLSLSCCRQLTDKCLTVIGSLPLQDGGLDLSHTRVSYSGPLLTLTKSELTLQHDDSSTKLYSSQKDSFVPWLASRPRTSVRSWRRARSFHVQL
eukprot:gb/GEZN01003829.1/.p1 GENE.gb/GEZN01003829.1/~~gb/GEZN01003829.1/.p1  ORF type:complete len:524 (-),score=24.24 gb/GEZN01003829.1/:145-1716(-)